MKKWFKRKSKKDKLHAALLAWYEENQTNKAAFMVLIDKGDETTSGALYGNEVDIVNGVVNEALSVEDIAYILIKSAGTFIEYVELEEEESKKEKPKKRRKKTDKVVS